MTLRGIKSKESLYKSRNRRGKEKLGRKKSLNDHLMTPMIKKNSQLKQKASKTAKTNTNQTYRLFYSPREIRSQLLNLSSNNTKRLTNYGTIADSFGNSKYFKKIAKKSPLFDLSKTMFARKSGGHGSEANIHNKS